MTPLTDALAKDERHLNVAETRYWCDQYKSHAKRLERSLAERDRELAEKERALADACKLYSEYGRQIVALTALLREAVGLLKIAKCPDTNCEGKGWSAVQVGLNDWEQVQCQWCDERNTIIAKAGL